MPIENKYCKINGETKIVKYKSSNENIMSIDSSGNFDIYKHGNVIITISIDNNFANVPFKIASDL
jgi:hypothetical protein